MLTPGTKAPGFELERVGGGAVRLEELAGQRVLLIFYRFAGCPACNLHVAEYVRRYDEVAALGLRHVAVFHSRIDEMQAQMEGVELPFEILADPKRRAFEAYEVERSWAGVMSPRFMTTAMRGMISGYLASPFGQTGGMIGLPASFMLDESGTIRACHYGRDAGDSWDVDTALGVARDTFGESADRTKAHGSEVRGRSQP